MKNLSVFIFSVSILLTACSTHLMKSRDNEYLQAKTAPILKTPADVSQEKFGQDYPVSGNVYPNSKPVSLLPPTTSN